jgi:hypothetical protein
MLKLFKWLPAFFQCRAKNGIRTRDLHLGKVALYQLSYFRIVKERGRKFHFFPSADANL